MANITPKWANEEWCIQNDNHPDCATYLKLTNVGGGPSPSLQYLDFSCSSNTDCKFNWSEKPRYSKQVQPS